MAASVELDRVAPTRRPAGHAAGHQRWRELCFVHWAFDPAVVRPLVPCSLELDPWDGHAFVGLVPFRMEAVRTRWMPRALGLDFLETNLRTYVHAGGKPGVFFFSLEASSWLAVKAARAGWGLPYFHAAMATRRHNARVEYRSRRKGAKDAAGARLELAYDIGGALGPSEVGTLQHFLLERYHLFNERKGRLRRGQVHHTPYPARAPSIASLDESLLAAAGLPAGGAPAAVHYSDGVDVEVFGPYDDV